MLYYHAGLAVHVYSAVINGTRLTEEHSHACNNNTLKVGGEKRHGGQAASQTKAVEPESSQSVRSYACKYSRFCPKKTIFRFVSMANENGHSTIIPVSVQLCAYSGHCNVKQTNLPPLLLLLFSNFLQEDNKNAVFLCLCKRSESPLRPPRTTRRFCMWVGSKEWF